MEIVRKRFGKLILAAIVLNGRSLLGDSLATFSITLLASMVATFEQGNVPNSNLKRDFAITFWRGLICDRIASPSPLIFLIKAGFNFSRNTAGSFDPTSHCGMLVSITNESRKVSWYSALKFSSVVTRSAVNRKL